MSLLKGIAWLMPLLTVITLIFITALPVLADAIILIFGLIAIAVCVILIVIIVTISTIFAYEELS